MSDDDVTTRGGDAPPIGRIVPSRLDGISPLEAWQLLRRIARANGVELYGEIQYNEDRHSLIVPLQRGDVEVSVIALDNAIGRDEFIKQCVFRCT